MWIRLIAATGIALMSIPVSPTAGGQNRTPLAMATSIRCAFSLMTVGTWGDAEAEAHVQPADLELQFVEVNADEATARLEGGFGTYDIIVRYADGYLHFMQSYLNGPLYITTVLEEETTDGKLKAMHSRHEYADFALPGFTSSPEQYYGACEILN